GLVRSHYKNMYVECRRDVILSIALGYVLHENNLSRLVFFFKATTANEMCIVQQCNWSAEPFTTSFVYRKPGSRWGWFYFDHQDLYWDHSRASIDTNLGVAVFYRGNSPAVTFVWGTEIYTMHRWSRTLTGAQELLPAGWS